MAEDNTPLDQKLWTQFKARNSDPGEIVVLLNSVPPLEAARALDRLRVASFIALDLSGEEETGEVPQDVYQYTMAVHNTLFKVAGVLDLDGTEVQSEYSEEPSYWTRRLMEHYQRLHNIQMYNRIKKIKNDDRGKTYTELVKAHFAEDSKVNALKLSVALAKGKGSLHWSLFGGKTSEDIVFFLPTVYLTHSWISIDIDGTERRSKRSAEDAAFTRFFEMPTVLSQFYHHSFASLESLRLVGLVDVQFLCNGDVRTTLCEGHEDFGITPVRYATMGMGFSNLKSLELIDLPLLCLSFEDIRPFELTKVVLERLDQCEGTWDPVARLWRDLSFGEKFRALRTLNVTGGAVSVSSVSCPMLKVLEIGSVKRSAPPGNYSFQGPAPFPSLFPDMPLEMLAIRDGMVTSIPVLHRVIERKGRKMTDTSGKTTSHNTWEPIFPTLKTLKISNVRVKKGDSLRQLSRLNTKTKGPRTVIWENVELSIGVEGGGGFQLGDQDPTTYGSVGHEISTVILRRMVNCRSLTVINEDIDEHLVDILKFMPRLETLRLEDVGDSRVVNLPSRVARTISAVVRPNIVFDNKSEITLAKRGVWNEEGTAWALPRQNRKTPAKNTLLLSEDLFPVQGQTQGSSKLSIISSQQAELNRISECLGPLPDMGDKFPPWIAEANMGEYGPEGGMSSLVQWEQTLFHWLTQSVDGYEDLMAPFYEGVSTEFTFESEPNVVRSLTRNTGANGFLTRMQYSVEEGSHMMSYVNEWLLPDQVFEGYTEKHAQELEKRKADDLQDEAVRAAAVAGLEMRPEFQKAIDEIDAKRKNEREELLDPQEETEMAINRYRPMLLEALKKGEAGIQIRIRAGPRHLGWSFFGDRTTEDTEGLGVASTSHPFDHTFTFSPYDNATMRGYVIKSRRNGSVEVVYRDLTMSNYKDGFPVGKANGRANTKAGPLEIPLGIITFVDDSFTFKTTCRDLMNLLGLRIFQSMAFGSMDLVMMEYDYREAARKDPAFLPDDADRFVDKQMEYAASPEQLGMELWRMEPDGAVFRVVPVDYESSSLYKEILDLVRITTAELKQDPNDSPFWMTRAESSNLGLFAYLAVRCMDGFLSTYSDMLYEAYSEATDRFVQILFKEWVPLTKVWTKWAPVELRFDTGRAMMLFNNLAEIFVLAKSKRRYKVPLVLGQSKRARSDMLAERADEILELYARLIGGIQEMIEPMLYNLMFETHEETYYQISDAYDETVGVFLEMQQAEGVASYYKELEEKIQATLALMHAFFVSYTEELEETALAAMDITPDNSPGGKGKEEEVPFSDDEEDSSGSGFSTPASGSPGIIVSPSSAGSSLEEELDQEDEQELLEKLRFDLFKARNQADSHAGEDSFLSKLQAFVRREAAAMAAKGVDSSSSGLVTPKKKKSPSPELRKMSLSPEQEKLVAAASEKRAKKRRGSTSPSSLLSSITPRAQEVTRRISVEPAGDAKRPAVLVTDAPLTTQTRAQAFLQRRADLAAARGEVLYTAKGVPLTSPQVQVDPSLLIDTTTTPSPPAQFAKRRKKKGSPGDEARALESARKAEARALESARKVKAARARLADAEAEARQLNFGRKSPSPKSPRSKKGSDWTKSKIASKMRPKACANIGCRAKVTCRCSECRRAYYCGKTCQRAHYHKHKHHCRK